MKLRSLALLLALWSPDTFAQAVPVAHRFVPSHPITSDFVRLRTDVQGCFSIFGSVTVLASEPAIEVRFSGSDLPCDPNIPANVQSPRFADVGMLPAGNYATRIYSCGFGPMGTVCDIIQTGRLVVQDSRARRTTVPALSAAAAGLLALLLSLLGARGATRR